MRMQSSSGAAVWMMLACMCTAAQTPGAPDAKPAQASGTVTSSQSGEPIAHAKVTLRWSGESMRESSVTTGADGKFSIGGLTAGLYSISVAKAGFLDMERQKRPPFMLRAGDSKSDINLSLMPGGVIRGRVSDADGNPVENAEVEALSGNRYESARSGTTDSAGRYRVGGLAPGKYRVLATPRRGLPTPPETRTDGSREDHFSPTYFGGSLTASGAAKLDVRGGADIGGTDIALVRTPIVSVSGKVTGFPPANGNFFVQLRWPGDNHQGAFAEVRRDGSFDIWQVDPGSYEVVAKMGSQGQELLSAPVAIEVAGKNIEKLELRMAPPVDLSGSIEYFDDAAKQGPRMFASRPPGQVRSAEGGPDDKGVEMPLRVTLNPVGAQLANLRPARVDADGAFALQGVPPARYRVSVQWPSVYVRSIRLGPLAIDGDLLDLRTGGGGPVVVVLSSGMANVSGVVKDASGPVNDVAVLLVAQDKNEPRVVRQAQPGKDGAYTLMMAPPGKYKLVAVDVDDQAAIQGVGLEEYAAVAENIELHEHDNVQRDLRKREQ